MEYGDSPPLFSNKETPSIICLHEISIEMLRLSVGLLCSIQDRERAYVMWEQVATRGPVSPRHNMRTLQSPAPG